MRSLNSLALRSLVEHPARAVLSILAVTLSVATIIAASMTSQSIIGAIAESDALTYMQGIIDQLGGTLQMIGVGIGLVAGFMIFNTFLMSITQRRQQIGTLRSLGMTRSQVMRLVLIEGLIIALSGTLAGMIAGPLMGYGTITLVKSSLSGIFAFEPSSPTPASFGVAAAVGIGVTLLSVLIPAQQAARVAPLVALRSEMAFRSGGIKRARVTGVIGALLLAGLVLFVVGAAPGTWVAAPVDLLLTILCLGLLLTGLALILPGLIGGVGRLARGLLTRRWGAVGRVAADNVTRERGRVLRTAAALAVSLAMIVGLTGFIRFAAFEILLPSIERVALTGSWMILPFDLTGGTAAVADMTAIEMPPEAVAEVRAAVGERGIVMENRFVIVPELAFFGDTYFSFLLDPHAVQQTGAAMFQFIEGDWDHAMPVMENGCGVLVAPLVASRNGAALGDPVTVTGANGPVECTIAGIGAPMVNASIISLEAGESFGAGSAMGASVWPRAGTDEAALRADVEAALSRYPSLQINEVQGLYDLQADMFEAIPLMFNGLLLLAMVAAGLGVVNTTLISIAERRQELGLLRAIGATRRQVMRIVTTEAALMGLIGGVVGLVAGLGVIGIIVLVYGGSSWGAPELDLWGAAGRAAQPALLTGLVGLLAAPLISAAAAHFPARSILRGSAIDTMDPLRTPQVSERAEPRGVMRRLDFLALRNLQQHRTRSILSILAVALGVAMTIAASMSGQSILSAVSGAEGLAYVRGIMEQLRGILEMIGIAIGLVAGFMVFNAFLMSITQRRQQIGALRSLGMTRGQVIQLVLVEALVVAIIGTLAGMVAGPLLGAGAAAFARIVLSDIFALKMSSPTLTSVVLAVGVGIGVTLLAVIIPARQAARVSPLVALRGEVTAGAISKARRGLAFWVGTLVLAGLAAFVIGMLPGEWVNPPQDILLTGLCLALLMLGLALVLPSIVGGAGSLARVILRRLMGASGRLAADNLGRERGRVLRTLGALAVSLAMITGLEGTLHFVSYEIMLTTLERVAESGAWIILPFNISEGMAAAGAMERAEVPTEATAVLRRVVGERGTALEIRFIIVPELSFIGDTFFSILAEPHVLRQSESTLFAFTEGNWDTAMPVMERGCGVLASPAIAVRNRVKLGDRLTVTGKNGPVECTLAGIGSSMANATIISEAAGRELGAGNPTGLIVWARAGADRQAVQSDMEAALAHYPGLYMTEFQTLYEFDVAATQALPQLLNILLIAAIVAAALGVVNTTLMSVTERRQELGMLRAVGATRRQVVQVVVGEAALIGLVGGVVGLVAGVGITAIVVLVYGGNAWGAPDLDLWAAAWRSTQPALAAGLIGLVAAPFISMLAAYFPARSILRGTAIETMVPERLETVSPRRAAARLLTWGSIRTRFAFGTALLMLVVLGGLIVVVTAHARSRIEETMHDALRQMVTFNAGMLELSLPEEADNLELDSLTSADSFNFDSDAMLQFESLVDDMSANGLLDLTIADRNNVILMSMDRRDIGMLAPVLEQPGETAATSERADGKWLIHASAPVRNEAGAVVGSVRMTMDAAEAQSFLSTLRERLWIVGGVLAALGTLVAWGIGTPLARTVRRLAEHAGEVRRGEFTLLQPQRRRGLGRWLSVRAQLTLSLLLILVVTVGILELVTLPIERQHLEETLKDGLVTGAEWIGHTASESFAAEGLETPQDQVFSLQEALDTTQALDLARLQALGEQARTDDLAFTALANDEGEIILSDQLALMGEIVPLYSDTRVDETVWRGDDVWVASTPLRRGAEGEQLGVLRMAVRREPVESFLDEARTLFTLAGLIAVLAGVLVAQAIGGTVIAPVQHLAAGTRQIGEGDLAVRFKVQGRDELAALANAYNHMVIGLQEREWLRDMFGRFVSQEVAEALRTGQVRLEGENRVVSILFTDIRDFTALSEQHSPEEVVALLNEYLPLVVESAQMYGGTVNKFGGDSTLIVYGAPRPLEESAYQSIRTALKMRANLAELNSRLEARGAAPLRIGIGINTGCVVAGAVGPQERQEYTVIGDAVNLASRIQALNKQYPEYDILISQWTYEALGSHRSEFELISLGDVAIRGKTESVTIWAVVGAAY